MPAMDTLLSMKVFRQVVESGSFVGAADRLSLSTAMTSKHLMHLEKHLGTRLLNRSSRSLSLTESGKLFFERCKGILEEVEEAELAVGSISGVPRGTLRVTAPSWGATRSMVDLVATYRQRYPEVVVDLSFGDWFVDLIEEGYDLAIRATADPPPAGLIARPLRPHLPRSLYRKDPRSAAMGGPCHRRAGTLNQRSAGCSPRSRRIVSPSTIHPASHRRATPSCPSACSCSPLRRRE